MDVWKFGLGAVVLTVSLVSCPGGQPADITPTKGNVNGFAINSDQSANLNVSALDNSNAVLRSGKLTAASVTGASLLSWNVTRQAATPVTAVASVCGDITSQSGSLTAGILLDASGSMSFTDPDFKRADAAKAFVDRLQGSDLAAVTSFSSGADKTSPYEELTVHIGFSGDKAQLKAAVGAASVAYGGTPLWKSTTELVDFISKQSSSNKVGVILTDGAAEDGGQLQAAIDAAKAAKIRLFMLGLGTPGSLDVADMQKAATDTGGLYAVTSSAADLNLVFNGAFNASQGAGCIKLAFTPTPVAGNKISGTLNFSANGVPLSTTFTVQY